jgi:hypothetical protein
VQEVDPVEKDHERGHEHGDSGDQGARTQVPVEEEGDDNLGKKRENRVKVELCTALKESLNLVERRRAWKWR